MLFLKIQYIILLKKNHTLRLIFLSYLNISLPHPMFHFNSHNIKLIISRGRLRRYKDLPPVWTVPPFLSAAVMARKSDIQSTERMEVVNYMRNWFHVHSYINYDWTETVEVVSNERNRDDRETSTSIGKSKVEAGRHCLGVMRIFMPESSRLLRLRTDGCIAHDSTHSTKAIQYGCLVPQCGRFWPPGSGRHYGQ